MSKSYLKKCIMFSLRNFNFKSSPRGFLFRTFSHRKISVNKSILNYKLLTKVKNFNSNQNKCVIPVITHIQIMHFSNQKNQSNFSIRKFQSDVPKSIASALICVFVLPPVTLLLIPFYIYRIIIINSARLFKPTFGPVLSYFSALFASSNPFKNPKMNLIVIITLKNKINLKKIVQVGTKVLKEKKFKKAKQSLIKWMGYFFWEDCADFQFENQVFLHKELIDDVKLDEITETLLIQPFIKGKPLWDLNVYENYKPCNKESIVVLRVHHCLTDFVAFSEIIKEINKCNQHFKSIKSGDEVEKEDSQPIASINPNSVEKQNINSISILKLLILGPFELIKSTLIWWSNGIGNVTQLKPTYEYSSFEAQLKMGDLKEIAMENGVKMKTLIFAAFTAAVRQMLMDLGTHPIPEFIHIAVPFPLPWSRPPDLNNYLVGVPILIPVGEENPFCRLKTLHNQFESLKNSTDTILFFAMYLILGGLPNWIISPFNRIPARAIAYSMGSTPSDINEQLGVDVKMYKLKGAMPYGDVVMMGFFVGRLKDQILFQVKGDIILFGQKGSSKKFIKFIENEVKIFKTKSSL